MKMSMEEKLKALEKITGKCWGIMPVKPRICEESTISRLWVCIREDKTREFLLNYRFILGRGDEENFDPVNIDDLIFLDVSREGAVDFALKTLDPDGELQKKIHYTEILSEAKKLEKELGLDKYVHEHGPIRLWI